ncbi:MAG: amidohydrolase family protein [Actinomycetia bacterium]|nr:amidohydrolase family protein [Actinomycetes bacterium]
MDTHVTEDPEVFAANPIGSGNMEAGLSRKQVDAYGRMATFAAGSVNLFLGNRVPEERPDLDRLPSEYFASNVYACYWFEQVAPRRLIDRVGADSILFETDFPHPTSLYGDEVHDRISQGLGDTDPEVRPKILWSNAQQLYRIDEPTAADRTKLAAAAGGL